MTSSSFLLIHKPDTLSHKLGSESSNLNMESEPDGFIAQTKIQGPKKKFCGL